MKKEKQMNCVELSGAVNIRVTTQTVRVWLAHPTNYMFVTVEMSLLLCVLCCVVR
jgi:hypothetical protein